MKIQELLSYIQILCLLFAVSLISACDTNNLLGIDEEMLDIDLESESQTLNIGDTTTPVSYTHLTLPTTPYV